jgi:hypothetical protein
LKAMKLEEFRNEDRKEFFEKLFKNQNVKKTNIEKIIESIEKFLKKLSLFAVTNPMLLSLIAGLFEDDPSFQLEAVNLYSLYDSFVSRMIRNLFEKGPQAMDDSTDFIRHINIEECHRKKAMEEIFVFDPRNHYGPAIQAIFSDCSDLSVDQMVRIGLMFDDGAGQVHFIHRTFAEFFFAQSFINGIFRLEFRIEDLSAWITMWNKVMSMSDGGVIRRFVDCAVEGLAIVENEKFRLITEAMGKSKTVGKETIMQLISDGCMNLINFYVERIFSRDVIFDIFLNNSSNNSSVLMLAAKIHRMAFIEELWKSIEQTFTDEQIKTLLSHQNDQRENVLHFAVQNESDDDPLEFFLTKIRGMFDSTAVKAQIETNHLLGKVETSNINSVLNRCRRSLTASEFEAFFESNH